MITNPYLLKAFAIALTMSQILGNQPVKTAFDPNTDQAAVLEIYKGGCQHVMHALIEVQPDLAKVSIPEFLDQQLANARALHQPEKIVPQLSIADARAGYDLFCLGQIDQGADLSLPEVLSYYNDTLKDLPDVQSLVDMKLPEFSEVNSLDGQPFSAIYSASRRHFVALKDIPVQLQNAFIAAEDKNFYSHNGIDEHGVIRAALKNMSSSAADTQAAQEDPNVTAQKNHDEGGSTITQQLIKNLFTDGKVTYERKLREMVLASRAEAQLGKARILELYLNFIYLGRAAWGVEMAAESFFGKHINELSLAQMAFLAGMPKGPNAFDPDHHAKKSVERTLYVLENMHTNGMISAADWETAKVEAKSPGFTTYVKPYASNAGYFLDEIGFQVKKTLGLNPRETSLEIESTLRPDIQASAEAALQEGLVQWELRAGRAKFSGREASLTEAMTKQGLSWQAALNAAALPLADVHWTPAVVLDISKKGIQVGLGDGSILPLKSFSSKIAKALAVNDVIFVVVSGKDPKRIANLRYRPDVQGAVVVMENATGRVVGMVGGFSHGESVQNRAVHMVRQPGSTVKPLTYLMALQSGLEPDTLLEDAPITLNGPGLDGWSPNDAESNTSRVVSLRDGLEHSLNRVTARSLQLFGGSPNSALDSVLNAMQECGVAQTLPLEFSSVIGTMDVPVLNMTTCFAALANQGLRPTPHLFDSVKQNGQTLETKLAPFQMNVADDVAFFQLRSMMQGVIARGTAAGLNNSLADVVKSLGKNKRLSDYLAGKTGTTQESNDAWFIGSTHDLTIAVWVGYDNATKATRRTLGSGEGASVAAPIFANVLRGTLTDYPLVPLEGPSKSVQAKTVAKISPDGILEYYRTDKRGRAIITRESFATPGEFDYLNNIDTNGPVSLFGPDTSFNNNQDVPPPQDNTPPLRPRRKNLLDMLFGN